MFSYHTSLYFFILYRGLDDELVYEFPIARKASHTAQRRRRRGSSAKVATGAKIEIVGRHLSESLRHAIADGQFPPGAAAQ